MKTKIPSFYLVAVLLFSFFLSESIFAQMSPLQCYRQSYQFESQIYNGNGLTNASPTEILIGEIILDNVPWIQLHFSKMNLGNESYITIRSLLDDKWQKLDAVSMMQWNNYSAFFNGNAVEIKLFLSQTDEQVFVNIDEIVVGEWGKFDASESQCGPTDDRVLSNQPATARLVSIGCTAWIIPNGKFATAGHCLSGSGADIVEFNVPLSTPSGTLQHPGPEDQYSVNASTKLYTDGGVGNDWGVFEVYPNSVTGLMPKQAQNAFWPLAQDLGPDSIRITGYGVDYDNTIYTQVQQTHVGPNIGSGGTTLGYATDTEGGNSGSPVIDALTNTAIGIHTHGGCTTSGGNNNGTSMFHTALWAAVDQGAGGCPVDLPSNPAPANTSTGVPLNLSQLTWQNGTGAVSNELYFGTNPSALNLVQSGSLATSWNITGVTFTYKTKYYWRVVEIGDTCNTNGPLWSFTTVPDPNMNEFCEEFNNLSNWTIVGPAGLTNWTANNSTYAGGTAPELRMGWSPSFTGVSTIRSAPIALLNNSSVNYSFNYFLDWYANPSGVVTVGITYDGGTTQTVLYQDNNPTGNTGPTQITGSFTTPASGASNARLQITYDGYTFNIDYIYWDNLCLDWVVPVELTSFAAATEKNNVILNWSTATEINNNGFQIERSNGDEYQTVGFTAGHGTTTDVQNYTYVDQNVKTGKYTYRLKQIDFDGTFEYSNTIEVEVLGVKEFSLDQNYPNPFNPSTKINFSLAVDSKVSLKVFDVLGQEVATLVNGQMTAGSQEVNFDASSLNSGVYFYRIDADGIDGQKFSSVKKMILTK